MKICELFFFNLKAEDPPKKNHENCFFPPLGQGLNVKPQKKQNIQSMLWHSEFQIFQMGTQVSTVPVHEGYNTSCPCSSLCLMLWNESHWHWNINFKTPASTGSNSTAIQPVLHCSTEATVLSSALGSLAFSRSTLIWYASLTSSKCSYAELVEPVISSLLWESPKKTCCSPWERRCLFPNSRGLCCFWVAHVLIIVPGINRLAV